MGEGWLNIISRASRLIWHRKWIQRHVPCFEVGVDHPVWESFPADPDAFEDSVAGQLMHYQDRVNLSGLLVGIGNHAAKAEN